jgi:hypothetical protein
MDSTSKPSRRSETDLSPTEDALMSFAWACSWLCSVPWLDCQDMGTSKETFTRLLVVLMETITSVVLRLDSKSTTSSIFLILILEQTLTISSKRVSVLRSVQEAMELRSTAKQLNKFVIAMHQISKPLNMTQLILLATVFQDASMIFQRPGELDGTSHFTSLRALKLVTFLPICK